MKIETLNEPDLVQEGLNVLTKNLPPSTVARLLAIWRVGSGDYTAEREKLFESETLVSLFIKARAHEKQNSIR